MAQSITFNSGSPLIDSPIVYNVVPSTHQSSYAFHRTILRVYAGLETDTDYTTFDFSAPVTSNAAIAFDISSALRAVADKYQYSPTPPARYPYIKFRLEAHDEWMSQGVSYENQGMAYYPTQNGYLYAFMGGFTDMERLTSTDADGRTAWRFTRKPISSPEIVFVGKEYIRPANFTASMGYVKSINSAVPSAPTAGPKSYVVSGIVAGLNNIVVADDTVSSADNETIQLYGITPPSDGFEIRFINGMGCLESLHVRSFVTTEAGIESEKHVISRQETFKTFSRGLYLKRNNKESWKLTSGPVDRQWASWYVHEFLMAQWVWIKVSNTWLPCHVVPEETVKVYDRTSGQPPEIAFTLELDINGSPIL